ncbi:MAG: hypothetical protein MI723_02975 [Caulobacterales bacterium]|nr:hypothetical protein [Caulobacterales bacterium]
MTKWDSISANVAAGVRGPAQSPAGVSGAGLAYVLSAGQDASREVMFVDDRIAMLAGPQAEPDMSAALSLLEPLTAVAADASGGVLQVAGHFEFGDGVSEPIQALCASSPQAEGRVDWVVQMWLTGPQRETPWDPTRLVIDGVERA